MEEVGAEQDLSALTVGIVWVWVLVGGEVGQV